ncbi:hypothetical protein [Aeromonas sp. L_1B5_3]|uniref:hypothetical protein n=1 Tax=Aeromonas sp. L_1B5_3 TaxID=1588629 RepID=UPI0005B6AEA3|nr:hypothetical protein [Aeromonas sp. L_1B5_3]KIQ84357.1 hypothetical protein RW26_02265 [Aeromonas sp. L_1B5_3]
MTLFIGLVVLACAVWVLFDSHKKGARNPAGWAVFVAVIWIIALPYYLYKRNKLEPAAQAPAPRNRWIGLAVVVVLVGGMTFNTMRQEALPACDAPEVVEVLGKLLNGMAVSNPAQRPDSEEFGAARLCNATVAERIQPYRVTWYSDDNVQFIVNLE